MSSSIIPFTAGAKLPAYMANKAALAAINKAVATGANYTTLSIKGKVFSLSRDNEVKVMTRADDPDEVLQSLVITAVRANKDSRIFFGKAYEEGEAKAARPLCFSHDNITPDADAQEPQAKKCATCKNNVWGDTPNGKGTACSMRTRLAVIDPEKPSEPMLLSVPPASRTAFNDTVKLAQARGIPYNALALKLSFDPTAATPKLVFKITGLLDDAAYATVQELYDGDLVADIVGKPTPAAAEMTALPGPSDADDELDAAIAARAALAVAKAKPPVPAPVAAKPKPVAKPVVEEPAEETVAEDDEAPAPVAKPAVKAAAPKPVAKPVAAVSSDDSLLDDLDSLLSNMDD